MNKSRRGCNREQRASSQPSLVFRCLNPPHNKQTHKQASKQTQTDQGSDELIEYGWFCVALLVGGLPTLSLSGHPLSVCVCVPLQMQRWLLLFSDSYYLLTILTVCVCVCVLTCTRSRSLDIWLHFHLWIFFLLYKFQISKQTNCGTVRQTGHVQRC